MEIAEFIVFLTTKNIFTTYVSICYDKIKFGFKSQNLCLIPTTQGAACGFRKDEKLMDKSMETYKEATQTIIHFTNCPYQVFTSEHTADEVEKAYHTAAERGRKEGFTPLLVISSDTLAESLEYLEKDSYSKEKVMQQPHMDVEKMLKEQYEDMVESYQEMEEDELRDTWYAQTGEEMEEEFGETINEFSSIESFTDDSINETILLEIPVKNPWEVIAWVPMGGWNECPAAEEMMEVCRYWYTKYGAVPALVSSDTLEFVLEEPVADEEMALQAAKEHFAFCSDRVFQGTETETITELASCISKSKYWFFWWD